MKKRVNPGDSSGLAHPKHRCVRKKAEWIKVYSDGREVLNLKTEQGRTAYRLRVEDMAIRQSLRCKACHLLMSGADITFDHENGRGMNGSHRDDRILVDGRPQNAAVHSWCNVKKGSKRGY